MKKLLSILLLLPGLLCGQDILTKSYPEGVASFQSISALVNSNAEPLLASSASAGATTIALNFVPSNIVAGSCFVAIDRYTTNCEIRAVSSVSGGTVGVNSGSGTYALLYDHAVGAPVHFFDGSEPVPWTWMGAKQGNTNAATCSANVSGFNRLSSNLYNLVLRGPAEIFVPAGTWYINNQLKPERETGIRGVNCMVSIIAAAKEFVFTTDGETAMIHPYVDGVAVEYTEDGVSGRHFFNDFRVEGNFVANSCGILCSPQQPDTMENVRVDNCLGLYALCVADCQQYIIKNYESLGSGTALRLRSAKFVYVFGFNAETYLTNAIVAETQPGGITCANNTFIGVHLEPQALLPGVRHIDIRSGDNWDFQNVWITNGDTNETLFYFNFAGLGDYPIFQLRNIHADGVSTNFLIVHDVQRNITRTVNQCRRDIIALQSGSKTTSWAYELTGSDNGILDPPPRFAGGINLAAGTNVVNGPTIKSGPGVPSYAATNGSAHLRTDGGTNESLYVRDNGSWKPVVFSTSGTYTPVLGNAVNVAASTAYVNGYYRIGNEVTVYGKVDADPTGAGQTVLRMSLPIASNFSEEENAGGNASARAVAGLSASVYADIITGTNLVFEWVAVDTANRSFSFNATYRVQ